jgi:hypothetical protein
MVCIAGGIILRYRDTKIGAPLQQVPQQWWKLCRKVVYAMYIKWQYKWFGNKLLLFFFNNPLELTFWITFVSEHVLCNTSLKTKMQCNVINSQYQLTYLLFKLTMQCTTDALWPPHNWIDQYFLHINTYP